MNIRTCAGCGYQYDRDSDDGNHECESVMLDTIDGLRAQLTAANARIDVKDDELAELRRDAARYRWLATVANWIDDAVMDNFDIEPMSKATLDAAIDAARVDESLGQSD